MASTTRRWVHPWYQSERVQFPVLKLWVGVFFPRFLLCPFSPFSLVVERLEFWILFSLGCFSSKMLSLLVLLPLIVGIHAANDWTVPCTNGECSYDLAATNSTAGGSMRISGSTDAITDITTAAGWQILGCDPDAMSQDIRLVCTNEDDPTSQCGHLYRNLSAVNKLVRLPETCGGSAFARIANAWDSEDQSLPDALSKRLMRRDGTIPTVKALTLDTNWHEVDYSQTGPVNIEIYSAPGAEDEAEDLAARGLNPIGASKATTGTSSVSASGEISQPGGSASGSLQTINGQAPVDGKINVIEKAFKLQPLAVNKKVSLINQSANCGAAGGKLSVDLAANAKAQATITVAAKGTVVPPNLSSFSLVAGVTANIGGTVTMTAGLSGNINSGTITVLKQPVVGLNFPGVLTVGPVFQVTASMAGTVQIPMNMNMGINFVVNKAQLAFPASAGGKPASSAFSVGDMPLTINAEAGIKASGTMTAHMTPAILVTVDALNGVAKSQIDLALDTNAALTMGLDAVASGTAAVNVKSALAPKKTEAAAIPACKRGASGPACALPAAKAKTTAAAKATATKKAAVKATTTKKAAAKATKAAAKAKTTKKVAKATATKKGCCCKAHREEDSGQARREEGRRRMLRPVQTSFHLPTLQKKPVVKKPVAKKPVAKKPVAKKPVAKKPVAKKTTVKKTASKKKGRRAVAGTSGSASASFSGCVKVNTGISVTASASANFFSLFSKSTKATLFTKNFAVLNKCFKAAASTAKPAAKAATAASKKTRGVRSVPRATRVGRSALSCPLIKKPTLKSITSGTISKSSIH
ncbi:hypothetical protein HMN09_01221600 [Mycena chlorophos]|uniref:Uncharacterized protein n=1 Tax=Mycena chlorophos TaxID=658473 RepID=A0A8H6S6T5_MYCCL|nr:hypothetical protein HMN09_01221600 [Mycena chlorophos]